VDLKPKFLNGELAYPGKVKGIARIILDIKDSHKFKKGEKIMKKSFFYLLFIVLNILSFSKEKDNLVIGVIYDNFIQSKNISYSLMEKEINNLVGDK
jgi:hypothetical protein